MRYYDNEYFNKWSDLALQYLSNNYDLCYLRAMHEKNRTEGADTIIVGSSHAMNGINELDLKAAGKTIQFSISSQDLFFDFMHIKKAFTEGKYMPKRCLINLGYYMMYQDLSKAEQVKKLIPRVYLNLFGENGRHNYFDATIVDPLSVIKYDEDMFPPPMVKYWCEFWSSRAIWENGTYYSNIITRKNNNIFGIKKIDWNNLSVTEKTSIAIDRTENGHNKHVKHEETHKENIAIVRDMVEFLHDHGVIPLFFITPYTRYYNEYIYKGYKEDIFKTLDSLDLPVELFDMNDYQDVFFDEDFLDSDHLNDAGAQKATEMLNSYLELLNQ
ncbi:hypothetical protein [Butyrivibrio sp. MC2021]|uniref:hypothetical protein n=1 Tax=Butyrivibrio sp. MC2021 TaxID=1408306 RepID=UPI00047EDF0F|nr:hypothetical protein [Butyrivibrio sp. MC2021]